MILRFVITYQPWQYFFIPGIWQEFSAANFTPWAVLSFDIDYLGSGLSPSAFYIHHLVSLCLLSVVAFYVLRQWFTGMLSFLSVLLFIVSPPFAESAHLLMMRHYIEGMVFALLSVYFYVKALKEDSSLQGMLAALFYLFSCLAKEIFVPLVFVILLVPAGMRRRRYGFILPFITVAALYLMWRWFMLDRLLGGYGLPFVWPGDAILFLPRIAGATGGSLSGEGLIWWRWLIGISSLLCLILLFRYDRKALLFLLLISFTLFLPLIPVASLLLTRYVWLPAFCWSLMHVIAVDRVLKRGFYSVLRFGIFFWMLVLVVVFFYVSSYTLRYTGEAVDRQGKEAEFFLKAGTSEDLLIEPNHLGWHYDDLSWLRINGLQLLKGPSVMFDSMLLCIEPESFQKFMTVWFYDHEKGGLLSEEIKEYKDRYCTEAVMNGIRTDVPLSIFFEYLERTVSWEFGPYKEGNYRLFHGENAASSVSTLPLRGRLTLSKIRDFSVRLRYTSPDGWVTYSPVLKLDIRDERGSISWKR